MIGGYSAEAVEKPLHDYQKFAADWLLQRIYVRDWEGAGLFMDPGLGKTRTTLSILDVLFNLDVVKRALILAPLRPVYGVWPAEFKRWGFPQTHVILHKQQIKAMSYNCQVELANYEMLKHLQDLAGRWDIIVLDESTFVKTWSAKRTKYLRRMVQETPKRVILTGTPAANSLADLHAQLYMVDRGAALGRTVTQFRARFMFQGGWRGRNWYVREGVQGSILDAIKNKCLRMQAEDHLDMPKLVENEIWCELETGLLRQYAKLKRELYAELETGEVYAASASAAYMKCRQFANGQVYVPIEETGEKRVVEVHEQKLKALFELYEELAGKPLLVFYFFTHDRERIRSTRGSPFKDAPVIAGGMKESELETLLAEWNDGKHKALLCQWQSGSHGLNMQGACNDIACYGLIDSPETFSQAYRRVYRQGVGGDQVRIHKILVRGTVDQTMLERLQGKHKTEAEFLAALKQHARAV